MTATGRPVDTPEWEALRQATEVLYETFAGYPLRDTIEGCIPHCVDASDDARIRAKPLRELSGNDLFTFLFNNCAGTWGNVEDFKHFLPRLFELASLMLAGQRCSLITEQLGSAIWQSDYSAWPASERHALDAFCMAWWRAALVTPPATSYYGEATAETVLVTVAQFTDDLSPYLAAWRDMRTLPALTYLAGFVWDSVMDSKADCTHDWDSAESECPHDSYWQNHEQQLDQLLAWAQMPETARAFLRLRQSALATDPEADRLWLGDREYMRDRFLAWLEARARAD